MEFKRTEKVSVYKIEAKPGGGFVATSSTTAGETVEGATREEVVQKLQQRAGFNGQGQEQEGPTEVFKAGGVTIKVTKKLKVTRSLAGSATSLPGDQGQSVGPESGVSAEFTSPQPIEPQSSGIGTLLYMAGAVLAIVGIVYLLVHR